MQAAAELRVEAVANAAGRERKPRYDQHRDDNGEDDTRTPRSPARNDQRKRHQ